MAGCSGRRWLDLVVEPRPVYPSGCVDEYDLVIVGGGAAGSEAAFSVADGGRHRILLVESSHFGGTCTNHGCVPTKALVRSARLAHSARIAGSFGVRVGAGGAGSGSVGSVSVSVDWPAVIGRAYAVRDHMLRFGAQPFLDAGVEVRYPATAVLTGPRRVAVDGVEVSAAAVLLAGGLEPAVPPVPGLREAGYLDNEGALSLTSLPARLAVIGSGPIGSEFAQIFARFGVSVTVLEVAPRMLPPEEPESSAALAAAFAEEGIRVLTGVEIASVARAADGSRSISLADGSTIVADEILVATGRSLNGAALGLDAVGIEWSRKGIVVDSTLRTSVPWAWAAGDVVAGAPLFTHVASEMGQVAARNALGHAGDSVDLGIVPRVTFTDPEVASVGVTEAAARAAGRTLRVGFAALADAEKAQIDGQKFGHVKVVADAASGELLGCAIVAETAGDMIHEAVAMMAGRVPVGTVARAMHAYPTLSELMRSALSEAAG